MSEQDWEDRSGSVRSRIVSGVWVVLWVALSFVSLPAAAEESLAFGVFGGLHDINESDPDLEFGLELRKPFRKGLFGRLGLTGVLGATATDQEASWVYLGARKDFEPSPEWVVTIGFATSYYDEGDGRDLGGELEFRSSIELAYRTTAYSRVGLALYHLSNAGIYDLNPGLNSLVLTWSVERGRGATP